MASLADLFITYKQVDPPETDSSAAVREIYGLHDTTDQAERISRIIGSSSSAGESSRSQAGSSEQQGEQEEPHWYIGPVSQGSSTSSASVESGSSGGSQTSSSGNMRDQVEKIFKDNGIHARVTSYIRPSGAVGNAGEASFHPKGLALDIVPTEGNSFEQLRSELLGCSDFVNYLRANGMGVLDETDPAIKARTGATGDHYHIGPDRSAQEGWARWQQGQFAKKGGRISGRNGGENEELRTDWTKEMYNSYYNALKEKYGSQYDDSTYDRAALYMTAQSALESDWGQSDAAREKNNFAGYLKPDGTTASFKSMDEFAEEHVDNLADKWPDFIGASSFHDYISSLFQGGYNYSGNEGAEDYWERFLNRNGNEGVLSTILGKMNRSLRLGGKFTYLRQIYEKGKR